MPVRHGHFHMESGYHSATWLDLETLCLRPERVRPLADALGERLRPYGAEIVCGPLNEGAFIAMMVAEFLGLPFVYTERFETVSGGLFPIEYRLPGMLREIVRGKRAAIVNDVISAGSAVRGTLDDLASSGGQCVAVGTLVT